MRRAIESLPIFLALLAFGAVGYAIGHHAGWQRGREESAKGYSQAAANGYAEGLVDGMAGRGEEGGRFAVRWHHSRTPN